MDIKLSGNRESVLLSEKMFYMTDGYLYQGHRRTFFLKVEQYSSRPIYHMRQDVIKALKTVEDPELGIDIYTLGLIYDVQVSEAGDIYIKMTHTTPLCPYGNEITKKVKETIYQHVHPKSLKIEITFDPPWQPPQGLRDMLGV